jgi:hypothetical protein
MYRVRKVVIPRPALAAGFAALALVVAGSAAALASAPYTVKVKVVPNIILKSSPFTVTATGLSANTSQLAVFLDQNMKCAKTAATEALHPKAVKIISQVVVGAYTKTASFAALHLGLHHACGYLTGLPPQSLPRARSTAPYKVVPKGAASAG